MTHIPSENHRPQWTVLTIALGLAVAVSVAFLSSLGTDGRARKVPVAEAQGRLAAISLQSKAPLHDINCARTEDPYDHFFCTAAADQSDLHIALKVEVHTNGTLTLSHP